MFVEKRWVEGSEERKDQDRVAQCHALGCETTWVGSCSYTSVRPLTFF